MTQLLDLVLRAHGGLDRWKKLNKVSANIVSSGATITTSKSQVAFP
jgi:hypothetical protein